jgi:hypothetical protein
MDRPLTLPQQDPHAQLERAFIDEYLRAHHCSLETLAQLPPAEAAQLLRQASIYASGRLTEVESRAHYVDDLHRAPALQAREPHQAGTPITPLPGSEQ